MANRIRAAVARWCGPTAAPFEHVFEKQQRIETRSAGRALDSKHFEGVTIDCRPDVLLGAVDFDRRLVDGDLVMSPAVRLE